MITTFWLSGLLRMDIAEGHAPAVDYREWEHESRDPRDRNSARPMWPTGDDEHRDTGEYDATRHRRAPGYRPGSADTWSDPLDVPYAWDPDEHADSWQTGTGWASPRHRQTDDDLDAHQHHPHGSAWTYPDEYRSHYPDPGPGPYPGAPATRWGYGRIVDGDDPYRPLPATPPPATSRPAEMVHVPRHAPARRSASELDDEATGHGYLPAVVAAVVWCAGPVLVYLAWALTRGGTPEPTCVDPAGNPCAAPRTAALAAFVDNLPRLATVFGLSLVLALIIRWNSTNWRAGTVGFAAAVVGAGITTLVFSLVAPG